MNRIYQTYGPSETPLQASAMNATALVASEMVDMLRTAYAQVIRFVTDLSGWVQNRTRANQGSESSTVVINIIAETQKNVRDNSAQITGLRSQTKQAAQNGVAMKKMQKRNNRFLIAIIVLLTTSFAMAQGTPKLDITIADEKVNLTKAEKAPGASITYLPGDTLRYIVTASNIGDGLMTNPEIVDPIPAGVTYVADSATGENTTITFSINQGSTYMDWPPTYTVRNSKGILVKRKATPDMVTHIKWVIEKNLNPGEAMTLDFLVVVDK